MAPVVVAGEALVDLRPDGRGGFDARPGGSPANVAVTLGRLGRPVRLLTALGDDDRGALLRAHAAGSGVEVIAVDVPRTSTALVTLGVDGDARYELDLLLDLPEPAQQTDVSWVHVGSLAALLPPAADKVWMLAQLWHERAVVSYDPNLRRPVTAAERTRVEQLVALSRLVKLSVEDAALFVPTVAADEVARSLLDLGPEVVVLTRGARGAVAMTRDGGVVDVPAADGGAVVDTVGAGDAFMAGLVHALLGGDDLANALAFASVVARRTCERPGADSPWADQLDR